MPRSARTRITLFATAVTLSVCILVCAALYIGLHIALHREVDAFLQGELAEFKSILVQEEDDDFVEIQRDIRVERGGKDGVDLIVRLLDVQGDTLITSSTIDPLPVARIPSFEEANDIEWTGFETVSAANGASAYRICSQFVEMTSRGKFFVQAAYRLDRVHKSLTICRFACLFALLLAAGLSVLGGRAVARRSLRPVTTIAETAKLISGQRLSMRVPRSGANDELDDLADTLNEMLGRVETSFRQIQQFTADAAHELRTPLTALRGSAEFALGHPRTVEQFRGVIEQSLEYYRVLGRVTDDLLLLARLDAGQEPLRSEQFNVAKMLEEVVDLYRPLASEHYIEVDVTAPQTAWVHADPGKIRRVLSNLIDNAIKYMGGPGVVTTSIQVVADSVAIRVADTGVGISAENLPHVFERFYRVDRARAAESNVDARSIGLGLAICRSLIHAHAGTIILESAPGSGTRVSFTLPGGVGKADDQR